MNIPQGYKQTELGIIPEDWEIVNLGNVAKVNGRIGFRGYTVADLVGAGQGAYTIGGKHIANMIIDLSDAEYISWKSIMSHLKLWSSGVILYWHREAH